MNLNSRSLLFAGAIAGVGIGLLSSIPFINCLNCLLWAWVWLGGIAAVYLYRNSEHMPPLTITDGLIIGAVAGAIGAIVAGILSAIFGGLFAVVTNTINSLTGGTGRGIVGLFIPSVFSFLGFIGNLIWYSIIGAVGGLIATALIWKTPAATPPGSYPPPPPPTVPPSGPVG